MWVKICGMTRVEDAVAAARFGADAVGFIFADSPRRVSPAEARDIARSMPDGPLRVGVFVDTPPGKVIETMDYCGLDLVQLHGDEDEGYCRLLGDRVIKALRVRDDSDIIRARRYPCRTILLDGYASGNGAGEGVGCDWRLVHLLPRGKRVIVAGGLGPENVGETVKALKPYGVDVAGGVEKSPGVKDPVLMYRFIECARKADREVKGS